MNKNLINLCTTLKILLFREKNLWLIIWYMSEKEVNSKDLVHKMLSECQGL
jgi:hypothetical protein